MDAAAAHDADAFRHAGHALIDRLADYLAAAGAGELPVLPWTEPEAMLDQWPADFAGEPDPGRTVELLMRAVEHSNHLHHPRYVGHQVTAPLPLAALSRLVTAILNGGPVVYEMGPVAMAMEVQVVRWMCARLGYPAGADGILTSGGSLGNLTALLAARQANAGYDVWSRGHEGEALAVLVGEQAHYSVARAAQVMGLGRRGLLAVPIDERYRLRPASLESVYERAVDEGLRPIAVVASACCTATGSFDPLPPIADFCAERELWLHVDAAHGAPALLSDADRHRLAGIDRADSVVWDAHKMMMIPALCTGVLFRDGHRSYEAFAQEASYLLLRSNPQDEWYNLCSRTLECTKPSLSMPIYTALATYGERFFGEYVASRFALGRRFGEILAEQPDFEVPVEPEGNIVCFRYLTGADGDVDLLGVELDGLQERIRARILERGRFYLVQTRLPDGIYLRVTIINPRTSEAELRELIDEVRQVARELGTGGFGASG